jgi:hypothetical protein
MTVFELRNCLAPMEPDLEVILRVSYDDGDGLALGSVEKVAVDAGCTDTDACVIDGGPEESERNSDGEVQVV